MEKIGEAAATVFFVLGSLFFVKALGVVPLVFAFFTVGQ